jgi:uncharacterized protein (TIGR02147 family)
MLPVIIACARKPSMETTTPAYYLSKLRETLSLKQRNNPHYSLRAYARDIGIHPATLSQIINGKRALPFKDSEKVIKKLNLGPKERSLFLESLSKNKSYSTIRISEEDNRLLLDESYYKIIAEWEHYAVLELFNIPEFSRTKEDISARLNLTTNRTEVVVNNLAICNLIVTDADGKLVKIPSDVKTTEDIVNQALRDSHKEALQMGIAKIDEISIELRDFSSSTLAINLKKIPEAKALIREFRMKMAALLAQDDKEEVYQLAIQFYPLSQLNTMKHQELLQ